jgi:hypothetical protein
VRVITHRCLLLVSTAAALAAAPAAAHNLTPQPVRELVRIQGYKAPAPRGVNPVREVVFLVLGQQVRFAASEWSTFAFFEPSGQPPAAEPAQVALQGERPLLHSVTAARPDQKITILAERRPGSTDVFVLAVDLCPAQ